MSEDDFDKHFFDVNDFERRPGDVLVRYRTTLDLPDSYFRDEIIDLLKSDKGVNLAINKLCKEAFATKKSAVETCRQIVSDLLVGYDVRKKSYIYDVELFYYTKIENVPSDSHWTICEEMTRDSYI